MRQLTKEEAIMFDVNKLYEGWSLKEIALFQFNQQLLCIPFSLFHEAMEDLLGRPVYTHEFALKDELQKEIDGKKNAPTLEEIINLTIKTGL